MKFFGQGIKHYSVLFLEPALFEKKRETLKIKRFLRTFFCVSVVSIQSSFSHIKASKLFVLKIVQNLSNEDVVFVSSGPSRFQQFEILLIFQEDQKLFPFHLS